MNVRFVSSQHIWNSMSSPYQSIDNKYIASPSDDGTLKLLDIETNECIGIFENDKCEITSISWSNKYLAFSISQRKTKFLNSNHEYITMFEPQFQIKIWDSCLKKKNSFPDKKNKCIATLIGHTATVNSMSWSPNNRYLASASHDKTIKIWDSFQLFSRPTSSESRNYGQLCCLEKKNSFLNTYECIATLIGHTNSVESVSWSPDGTKLASASLDHTIKIWDSFQIFSRPTSSESRNHGQLCCLEKKYVCIATLHGHTTWVTSVCWSPDGTKLASSSCLDLKIIIWETQTYECIAMLKPYSCLGTSKICWSPDSTKLASSTRGRDDTISTLGEWQIKIWDIFQIFSRPTSSESRNHERKNIVFNDNNVASRKNIEINECIATLIGHTDYVHSLCWSPDSMKLMSSSENEIKIWRQQSFPETYDCIATLTEHTELIKSISWNNTEFVSSSVDGTIKIWELFERNFELAKIRFLYEEDRCDVNDSILSCVVKEMCDDLFYELCRLI